MIGFCWLALTADAQTATNAAAIELAQKIAIRMKDSLALTAQQQADIYSANLRLHEQKQQARQQHTNNPAQLQAALQVIEKGRDSLYATILQSKEFVLYKQRKCNLLNAN